MQVSVNLNNKHPLRDMGYSNALGSAGLPRHRWYFVKEAFSPHLVKAAIEAAQCKEDDIILDPFCGSGTVPVVAAQEGANSAVFEVNPFLAFVTRTKLLQTTQVQLERASCDVVDSAKRGKSSPLESVSTFAKAEGREKWLFNTKVLRAFEGGWQCAASLDDPERSLCQLALIGAAMDSCNAIKDGKCLRYRKDWKQASTGAVDFLMAFGRRVLDMHSDIEAFPVSADSATVYEGDSRSALASAETKEFRLCITSPPYLNSFDYSDVYRPELFLGRHVESNVDLMDIRLSTVRSHVQASWSRPTDSDFGPLYSRSIDKINARSDRLWSKNIPIMVQAYFEDMKQVLVSLRKKAKPDAQLWIVVSTSAYVGVEIPVDLVIAEIGTKTGWFLNEVAVLRHLRPASHHWRREFGDTGEAQRLRESLVVFSASPPQDRVYLANGLAAERRKPAAS